MRKIIPLIFMSLLSGYAHAQSADSSAAACLPPPQNSSQNVGTCDIFYQRPPLLRQDVLIQDCQFVPGQAAASGTTYRILQCIVFNGSSEPIESLRYGTRYMSKDDQSILAEGGFGETHRFSTPNIPGNIQPQIEMAINFLGPAVPANINKDALVLVVDVIGVYAPGSRMLR